MAMNGEYLVRAKLRALKKDAKEKRGDRVVNFNSRMEREGSRDRLHPTKGWRRASA